MCPISEADVTQIGGLARHQYPLVSTPALSVAPDESPLVTWGHVLGAPSRLVESGLGSQGLGSQGVGSFKLKELPRRDQMLHALASSAGKRSHARPGGAPLPGGSTTPRMTRCGSLSVGGSSRASPRLSAAGAKVVQSLHKLTPGVSSI